MAVREAGSRWRRGDADGTDRALRVLRTRWRTASLGAGWRYPSDWGVPEVDDVCASVLSGTDLLLALDGLARARAVAGAGLDETLTDLAALHAVLEAPPDSTGLIAPDPDATPAALLRATALAWADAALEVMHPAGVTLSGQATSEYLRVRLGEVYAKARRDGYCPSERFVLLGVVLDLADVRGWPRLMAMALVGDALRAVFDGGESVAVLGPSVAIVLAEREPRLAERTAAARTMVTERLAVDPALRPVRPEMRVERLPAGETAAIRLVHAMGRA
ncbi:GGDEF domain-containing protein [Actinokineospora sp. NBRC 105648]|uniref:GGDEF domain-containing protein n=1 Tax=Actinokineospora sp. NBRC 105648 TaxID=3032206 RepID=UPI002555B25E|nr:GGDEF domain-containing protein [Actinokineospora sp. NBRC 105648]